MAVFDFAELITELKRLLEVIIRFILLWFIPI